MSIELQEARNAVAVRIGIDLIKSRRVTLEIGDCFASRLAMTSYASRQCRCPQDRVPERGEYSEFKNREKDADGEWVQRVAESERARLFEK